MLKKVFFSTVMLLFITISIGVSVSFASVNADLSTGWNIHQYDGQGQNWYRYGPSFIINADNSIDAWFSSPGEIATADWYQQAGSQVADTLTDTIAQKFTCDYVVDRIQFLCPSMNDNTGSLTMRLYAWNTDYNTTVNGTPLVAKTFTDFVDNSWLGFDYYTKPGTYLVLFSNPAQTVGVWRYTGSSQTGVTAYCNGSVVSGNYQMCFGFNNWDCIRHKRSTDGGQTWSSETIVLKATLFSQDHYSVCDPGVVKFGGYYYLGYTTTLDRRGTNNQVCVARSTSPTGPFEKWNGTGWGGNPAWITNYNEADYRFGAGEPSFVVKDGTIYMYYHWIGQLADGTPTDYTKLATASASDPNWPGSLVQQGVVINNGGCTGGSDSFDVKYIDSYGKFVGMTTSKRFGPESYLRMFESSDGINFHMANMSKQNVLPYNHNCGISGTESGHINLSNANFVGYAYGPQWGHWNTMMQPISYSNDSLPAPPVISYLHAGDGQIKVGFETDSNAASYKIKYGTSSGSYTSTISNVTSSPYTITGLTNGTMYYVVVSAVNASGESGNSNQLSSEPQQFSVSPRLSATASSQQTGWEVSKVIDSDMTTTYSSQMHQSDSIQWDGFQTAEWVYVDTGSPRAVSRITLTNRQKTGLCAPMYPKLQISMDAYNWFDLDTYYKSYAFSDTDGYGKTVYCLSQPVWGRYVRLYVNRLGIDDMGDYYLQLADMKIEDVPFSASASSTSPGFVVTHAINGNTLNWVWSSSTHSSQNYTEWLTVDNGYTINMTGIRIKPRDSGLCFPIDFKIQSSSDGTNWTDIQGQSYTNYSNPGSNIQIFNFGNTVSARYVRVYASKLSSDGIGNYAFQVGQIYVDQNIKYSETASSISGGSFAASNVADGDKATFWSSSSHPDPNYTEWIKFDLGSSKKVGGLRLQGRIDYCFPVSMVIEYSIDDSTWIVVPGQQYSDYLNPREYIYDPNIPQLFKFSQPIDARYIRITATKLRTDDYNNYLFQLGDVYIDP